MGTSTPGLGSRLKNTGKTRGEKAWLYLESEQQVVTQKGEGAAPHVGTTGKHPAEVVVVSLGQHSSSR